MRLFVKARFLYLLMLAPVQSRFLKRKYGAQGSDPMKPKVKIPPKQRPIMFLMFGLGLVFPWVFVGLANFHTDTRYRSTSNKSRFRSNTIPWSGFYWRLE